MNQLLKPTAIALALSFAAFGCDMTEDYSSDASFVADKAARFQIKRTSDKQFHFTLIAANGEVVLSSETYTRKANAIKGIESVMNNAQNLELFEVKPVEGQSGSAAEHVFVLKAENGEPIGVSEVYSSKSNATKGRSAVKRAVRDVMAHAADSVVNFEIFKGKGKQPWRFRLKGLNGEIILASEGYASKTNAANGAAAVVAAAVGSDQALSVDEETGKEKPHFNIVAANSKVVGTSEVYSSLSNARRGLANVIETAKDIATICIEDTTK